MGDEWYSQPHRYRICTEIVELRPFFSYSFSPLSFLHNRATIQSITVENYDEHNRIRASGKRKPLAYGWK